MRPSSGPRAFILPVPSGLFLATHSGTATYMLMTLSYVYALPIDEMAKTKLLAADVAEKCFAGGGRWIAAAVMISTLGAANATILATARVYFAMARRNV